MQSNRVTGERRPVSVFFVDVVGSTSLAERMDPEDWAATMERAMGIMTAAVERYDGWVSSHTGDGLVAFFGIPVAHEDDPVRAISAGIDMLDDIARFADDVSSAGIDFQIRIGINTGEVVVRDTSTGGATRDSRMYGDAVNVAARIQAEARPGGILITGDTFARIGGGITTRHVGAVTVRGKEEPVDAYEVLGRTGTLRIARGIAGLVSPMVGRDRELEALTGALAPVRAGLGRMALVLGEPGIGKSRMLSEFRTAAHSADVSWFEARTVSYGRSVPLHLAVDLVRSLAGLPEPLESVPADEAVTRLRARVGELVGLGSSDVAPFLAHLLGLPLDPSDTERIARMEPRTLPLRYVEAIGAALQGAAADAPVALVCDDLHWADDASIDLFEPLLRNLAGSRILWVLASRPDREAPGWRLVTAARDVFGDALLELRLEPLDLEHGRQLVANLLEIESLPEVTRATILARAEGNPLFTEEIIRMLIDRGAIVSRDGRWEATELVRDIEIPDTLHGLLLARIDRLPAEARRVLRVASVIGRSFPVSVLDRVVEPT